MKLRVWIVMMVASAGCGDNLSPHPLSAMPADAGPDRPADAGIDGAPDAGVDASPGGLTEICGAEPVTFDDWEHCYQKRWCEWRVGCQPMNSYLDVPECMDRSDDVEGGRLAAELRERKGAVAAPDRRASIDVAAFTQCLLDTSAALCNTARYSVACATRFKGTIADGGDCYADIECKSPGATCESSCTDACCVGTCQPKLTVGDPCDSNDFCEPGLICYQTCRSGAIGTSCMGSFDCDSSAWCNAGVCAADLEPGSACTSRSQCGGDTTCTGLSIIDPRPGQCLSISKPGDPCDFICYGNLYCASGTCHELPTLGDACSAFTPCRGVDTICSNGVCVARGEEGARCSITEPCRPGLFCTSEVNEPMPVCALPRGADQPCTKPSHCESYLCSSTTGEPGKCCPEATPVLSVEPEDDVAYSAN